MAIRQLQEVQGDRLCGGAEMGRGECEVLTIWWNARGESRGGMLIVRYKYEYSHS